MANHKPVHAAFGQSQSYFQSTYRTIWHVHMGILNKAKSKFHAEIQDKNGRKEKGGIILHSVSY